MDMRRQDIPCCTAEERLERLGVELPLSIPPAGNYVRAVQTGNLLFLSGHLPDSAGEPIYKGKLGHDLSTEQGYEAARQAAINMLGTVRASVGSLDRVLRIVKLLGMVSSTETFIEQTTVINGASDFLSEVFDEEIAPHARSAVGMMQLPRGNCVEIEGVFEVA
jgi:enamine deaminase RidA (YjgF/YER057c/UK114 family)